MKDRKKIEKFEKKLKKNSVVGKKFRRQIFL